MALWRVLIFSIDQDEDLKPRVRTARERTIERMEIMYRPELSTLSERDRKHMLIALEAITDIESWARMRELLRPVVRRSVRRLDSRHRPHAAADAVDLRTTMALPSSSQDGRRLRSERTKQSIMEAYIDAAAREARDSDRCPDRRARRDLHAVDLRAVRRPTGLSLATADHAFAMGEAQAIVRNVDGDRPTRLRSHVETRAQTCERWLPVWRVVVANQGKLDELRDRIRFIRQAIVMRMELMYRAGARGARRPKSDATCCALEVVDRLRELGAHARGPRPVVRRGVLGLDAHDRSHAAADASRPAMSGSTRRRPASRVDGRRLRSERTKQLIIEAYLALRSENSPQVPTAAADRRARRLFRALGVRALSRHPQPCSRGDRPRLGPGRGAGAGARQPTATGATRIRTQVETRGQTCERWLPLWRSLVANQGEFAGAQAAHRRLSRERVVGRLELMYAPELSTLAETASAGIC